MSTTRIKAFLTENLLGCMVYKESQPLIKWPLKVVTETGLWLLFHKFCANWKITNRKKNKRKTDLTKVCTQVLLLEKLIFSHSHSIDHALWTPNTWKNLNVAKQGKVYIIINCVCVCVCYKNRFMDSDDCINISVEKL